MPSKEHGRFCISQAAVKYPETNRYMASSQNAETHYSREELLSQRETREQTREGNGWPGNHPISDGPQSFRTQDILEQKQQRLDGGEVTLE